MKPLPTLFCVLLLCGCETVPVKPTQQPQHKPITQAAPLPPLPPVQDAWLQTVTGSRLPMFTFNIESSPTLVQVSVVPAMLHLVWVNNYIMPTTETCVDGSTDLTISKDNWPCVFHGRTNECYLPMDQPQAFFVVSDYTPSP